jgi:hypothetical protein
MHCIHLVSACDAAVKEQDDFNEPASAASWQKALGREAGRKICLHEVGCISWVCLVDTIGYSKGGEDCGLA